MWVKVTGWVDTLNKTRLEMNALERVGITPIMKKIIESRLRWFRHVCKRSVEDPTRVNWMEGNLIARGEEKPRKTIGETIKNIYILMFWL